MMRMRWICGEWLAVGLLASITFSCGHAPATCRELLLPCPGDDGGAADASNKTLLGAGRDGGADGSYVVGDDARRGDSDAGGAWLADGGVTDPQPRARDAMVDDSWTDADLAVDGSVGSCNAGASPTTMPCLVSDTYGVFVAPGGASMGDGSKARPFSKIAAGLAAAKASNKRVFMCTHQVAGLADAGTDFGEPVTIDAKLDGIRMHGGYRCSDWQYVANTPTTVRTPAGVIPLTLVGASGVTIEDMSFEASNATVDGASSIAAFLSNATGITLRRVALMAGAGKDGAKVTAASNYAAQTVRDGMAATTTTGGSARTCTCGDGRGSTGGKGGSVIADENGQFTLPQPGDTGTPASAGTAPQGEDGKGGAVGVSCSAGGTGHEGAPAAAGMLAAGAASAGTLTAIGWQPTHGANGGNGSPGQGGGGGASRYTSPAGGGGGGGACGGCGGAGGPGGKGGGSSFALLSFQSTDVVLDTCELTTQAAGKGSDGASGQPGQLGGTGGGGVNPACSGGNGGQGGKGASGGGGAGGLSVTIAYKGAKPNAMNSRKYVGKAAVGGKPGDGAQANAKGVDGVAGEEIELSP